MMRIDEFRHSGPAVDDADVDEVERVLDVKLPGQYRTFLLRTNGGSPHPQDGFRACGEKHFGSIMAMFYAISHEREGLTLVRNVRQLRKRIPADLLPIGRDLGDNQICIGIESENYGRIYFWDMEFEAGPGRRPWRRNVRLIADSFDEFLDTFYDSDEEGTEELC